MYLYQVLSAWLAQYKKEEGQGMAEYALILALIAVALIIALVAVQGGISGAFAGVVSGLSGS